MNLSEFPHSEISGSKDVCSSPKLIAAYHVFHRLPVPRHSPCALFSLTVFYALDSPFANWISFPSLKLQISITFLIQLRSIIQFSRCIVQYSIYTPYSVVDSHFCVSTDGGLKWTRTIDLTIISRVLQPAELLAHVVEIKGIEPLTPCLQSRCSPS